MNKLMADSILRAKAFARENLDELCREMFLNPTLNTLDKTAKYWTLMGLCHFARPNEQDVADKVVGACAIDRIAQENQAVRERVESRAVAFVRMIRSEMAKQSPIKTVSGEDVHFMQLICKRDAGSDAAIDAAMDRAEKADG